jgi:hypothetical protein
MIAFYMWMEAQAKAYQSAGPKAKGLVGRGLPGDTGPTVDSSAPKRMKELAPVLDKTLYTLTGQRLTTPQEWEDWWKKNESSFKFP